MASKFKALLEEIHRRSIWQILIAYGVGSWFALGAAGTLMDVLGLPDWVPQMVGLVCLMLLPLVLATAVVERAATTGPEASPDAPDSWIQQWLTWRRVGVVIPVVFALLATGTTGYMGMQVMGIGPMGSLLAAGVLDAEEPIILADFQDNAGDSTLAHAVTEAFRVDLSQSQVVKVVGQSHVTDVLRLMERDADAPLDFETAREIAIREGLKAVIAGEIHAVGSGFVMSVRLAVAETGEELVSYREAADDGDAIIPAIERLSRRLRNGIGESLKTVRQTPRLARVRTASLEALKRHTEGNRANSRGDWDRCVTLLADAIALDTLFANAYLLRGLCYLNGAGNEYTAADLTRAFELRDRMTAYRRVNTTALYHTYVTGQPEKAVEAYEAYLDLYPDDLRPLNNLGDSYNGLRRYARAEEVLGRLIDRSAAPASITWNNLFEAQFNQGKFQEADETLRLWGEAWPANSLLLGRLSLAASARWDYGAAQAHMDIRRNQWGLTYWTSVYLAHLAEAEGKLREAEGIHRDRMATAEEEGRTLRSLWGLERLADIRLSAAGDTAGALVLMETELDRRQLEALPPDQLPDIAGFFARAGRAERARDVLRRSGRVDRAVEGLIALAEGRTGEAISDLRIAHQHSRSPLSYLPELGIAYEQAENADSALAQYERYIDTPYYDRAEIDGLSLAFVYERLATLYEQRGDEDKAVEYHGKLIDLWRDCDPELRPRVEAAERAILRLQGGSQH